MGQKSLAREVLEILQVDELKDFAEQFELPRSGTKVALLDGIVRKTKGNLETVMREGPWTLDDWNDFADELFYTGRRRSFGELAAAIDTSLERDLPGMVERLEKVGDHTVAEARRNKRVASRYAAILEMSTEDLLRQLEDCHGNMRVVTAVSELDLLSLDDAGAGSKAPERRSVETSKGRGSADTLESGRSQRSSARIAVPRSGDLVMKRYRLGKALTPGGFGMPFEARDEKFSMPALVIKFPHEDKADSLVREAQFALRLSHPNICRYYAIDEDPRLGVFVCMEHGGRSLSSLFDRAAADVPEAVHIITEAAKGLDYLHSEDVVHADVNPGNILVDGRRVRLVDFGISGGLHTVVLTGGERTRVITELRGIHRMFSAPEVHDGRRPRRASDQFSLALVFCAMLQSVESFCTERRTESNRLTREQNAAVRRALSYEPSLRFPSCVEFAEALR